MSIRLHGSNRESIISELVVEVEMQFTSSAALMSSQPFYLDIFYILSLRSHMFLVLDAVEHLVTFWIHSCGKFAKVKY
jgi:hypothetical protein